jgi:hypothetical protein
MAVYACSGLRLMKCEVVNLVLAQGSALSSNKSSHAAHGSAPASQATSFELSFYKTNLCRLDSPKSPAKIWVDLPFARLRGAKSKTRRANPCKLGYPSPLQRQDRLIPSCQGLMVQRWRWRCALHLDRRERNKQRGKAKGLRRMAAGWQRIRSHRGLSANPEPTIRIPLAAHASKRVDG